MAAITACVMAVANQTPGRPTVHTPTEDGSEKLSTTHQDFTLSIKMSAQLSTDTFLTLLTTISKLPA